jgi:hypothetical protein
MENTVCRDTRTHAWESTTSPLYRKCRRKNCQVAQRWQAGVWVDVPLIVREKRVEQAQPVLL